jgi:putative tryptophan/tyrosine transport system substrate-binding protein
MGQLRTDAAQQTPGSQASLIVIVFRDERGGSIMRRRDFIAGLGGAAAAWPLSARAQQRMPVIGYLSVSAADADGLYMTALRQGLNEGGYVEGRNIEILFRYADFQFDRLPSLASDLVRRRVDVIVASGVAPALAAKASTATIPIVFETASDPVAYGLVASLNRPGGNLTGASLQAEAFYAKGVELLHELVRGATSVALLRNPTNPSASGQKTPLESIEDAARTLGLRLVILNASNLDEIEKAFIMAAQERLGGVLLNTDRLFDGHIDQVAALAARYRVPAIFNSREYVQAGGLMSYGGSVTEAHRIVGNYAARILKGEKPADLPVQLSTRIGLALNLKAAKALGLDVPTVILLRADEVIE